MPYTEQDLLDAQVIKLRAEAHQLGKPSWRSHTYWIAIVTAIAALFSTVWQFFRSDTEYKLAEVKKVQADLDQRDIVKRVDTLKVDEAELQQKRKQLEADLLAAEAVRADVITQTSNLQDQVDRLTAELTSKQQLLAEAQQLSKSAEHLNNVAKEGAPTGQLWFVYLTTDDDPNAEQWSRDSKDKLANELSKRGFNNPLLLWHKNRRWAISVGDAVPEEKARELVNRLYKAGYKQVARSLVTGWNIAP